MSKGIVRITFQYLFGLLFLATALAKLLDNRGFAEILSHYQLVPQRILLPFALCLSVSELFLGVLLLRGAHLKRLAQVTALVNLAYFALAGATLYRRITVANCGCFGVFLPRPLGGMTLVEDGALVALSLLFVWVAWRG